MRFFQQVEHTADIRLRVGGSSLPELFTAALEGMNQILKKDFCSAQKKLLRRETISLSSTDITSLLIDFLSQVLTLTYQTRVIFCQIESLDFDNFSLTAALLGNKVETFGEDIKAVTYHEAKVVKNKKGNFETIIVFDV